MITGRYKYYGMMWRLEKMDLLKAKTTIGGVAYAVYPNIWGWQVGSGMLLFCW